MAKRILIVEDERDVVKLLRYNLEKEKGFSVLSDNSGDEGMNLALQVKPNLIILDNKGNELVALQVNVIRAEANNVEMFKGGAEGKIVGKYSYICAPDCESVVMPGDDNEYNAAITGQISSKSKEALSSAQAAGQ